MFKLKSYQGLTASKNKGHACFHMSSLGHSNEYISVYMYVGLERKPSKKSHVEKNITTVEMFAAKKQAVVFVAC